MLIGRKGRFTLKSPFSQYSTDGMVGEIVAVAYIKHLVATGEDVETKVYKPVKAENVYPADLSSNVIIVTIKASDGKKYRVPDRFIENLYNDSLIYPNGYVTVKIGSLPADYDYEQIAQQISRNLSDFTGVEVGMKDVFVSIAPDNATVYSKDEAEIVDSKRLASVANRVSDYGLLVNEQKKTSKLTDQLRSVENKLKQVSKVV